VVQFHNIFIVGDTPLSLGRGHAQGRAPTIFFVRWNQNEPFTPRRFCLTLNGMLTYF